MNKLVKAENKVRKKIEESCTCYVLISCSAPDENGKIDVQMDYEGDETLAAFLVSNAAEIFEEKIQMRESK